MTSASPSFAATSDLVQVSQHQKATDQQIILDEINRYRAQYGAPAVQFSATLSDIVQSESERMVREETFYHTDNFWKDPRAGAFTSTNEVIALEYRRDPAALVAWWMSSPAHRQAILDPRHDVIGVGIAYADGSLQNTGQQWQILSTVNLYGYDNGGRPADTSYRVGDAPSYGSNPDIGYQGGAIEEIVLPVEPEFGVHGGIGARYHQLGGEATFGQPIMNERGGLVNGGVFQQFERADGKKHTIYWTPFTGARAVAWNTAIGQKWIAYGCENGLGYPLTEEYTRNGVAMQHFSNGWTINWRAGETWLTKS